MEENQKKMPISNGDVLNPSADKTAKQTAERLQAMAKQGNEVFWAEMSKNISWYEKWNTVLDSGRALCLTAAG